VKQKKVHGFTPVKQKKILVSQGKLDKNFTGHSGVKLSVIGYQGSGIRDQGVVHG
jgi:hypothetical protein